jgi:hypothetical protein
LGQSKVIKYDSEIPFDFMLNEIWQFIISNDQLKAGAIKLKTSLTMEDINILIAEEIDLEDF